MDNTGCDEVHNDGAKIKILMLLEKLTVMVLGKHMRVAMVGGDAANDEDNSGGGDVKVDTCDNDDNLFHFEGAEDTGDLHDDDGGKDDDDDVDAG